MRVLFVYTREFPQSPIKPLVDFTAIQFGISYISSYLKKHGHETRLLILTRESNFSIIDRSLKDFGSQLICFTAVASEYLFIEKIGKYVKELYPDKFLLIGGVHVSLVPEESMLDTFNALCIGEGEEASLELVKQLEQGVSPSGIPNLWIKNDREIEKNPPRDFIADLDSFPFADRQMWIEWIDMERSPKVPYLLLGRGCPFNCTYCCNHALRKLAGGTYVRLRSPQKIVEEIEEIVKQFPMVKEIYFEIETFGANLKWAYELCSKLEEFNAKRTLRLAFGVNLRVTPKVIENEELFAVLKKSNFSYLNIGLESGSERVRREILKRHYSNEDIIKAVFLAKKHKLDVVFYNLIGIPTETISDFNETVKMNRKCLPLWNYLSIFYPYPGTDLFKLCDKKGILPESLLASGKERVKASLDLPDFSRKQIQKAFIWFNYYVYRGNKPILELAKNVLSSYLILYKGLRMFLLPFIITRDFLSPSLKFHKEYQEYKLYFAIIVFIFLRLLKIK